MRRVGFWFRVLALLIDLAIFLPLVIVPLVYFGASENLARIAIYSGWLVYSSFEVFTAGTPGKQFLRLSIANPNGSDADVWKLALRWSTKQFPIIIGLMYALSAYPLLMPLTGFTELVVAVGCLYASTDSKQTWHDQWAKTAVFRRPPAVERGFPVQPPPLPPVASEHAEPRNHQ